MGMCGPLARRLAKPVLLRPPAPPFRWSTCSATASRTIWWGPWMWIQARWVQGLLSDQ